MHLGIVGAGAGAAALAYGDEQVFILEPRDD